MKYNYIIISCFCSRATNAFVYYGLSLNSTSMVGNKYLNFALVCLIEIPGYTLAWVCIQYLGRRLSLVASLFLCGCTCIGSVLVPQGIYLFYYENLISYKFENIFQTRHTVYFFPIRSCWAHTLIKSYLIKLSIYNQFKMEYTLLIIFTSQYNIKQILILDSYLYSCLSIQLEQSYSRLNN